MPFEAIVDVSLAEERAKQLVDDAQAEAKRMVAEAEGFRKENKEKTMLKAKDEVDNMIGRTEAKAAEEIEKINSAAETKVAVLNARADKRITSTATMVVERIVNS